MHAGIDVKRSFTLIRGKQSSQAVHTYRNEPEKDSYLYVGKHVKRQSHVHVIVKCQSHVHVIVCNFRFRLAEVISSFEDDMQLIQASRNVWQSAKE